MRKQTRTAGRNLSFQGKKNKRKKHDNNLVYKQEVMGGWGEGLDSFFEDSDSPVDLCFGGTEKKSRMLFLSPGKIQSVYFGKLLLLKTSESGCK